MRTSLFVSTLFTASLVTGAALAQGPRVVDKLRAHGDVVDKSYSAQTSRAAGMGAPGTMAPTTRQVRPNVDRASSRVNCSESGAECAAHSGASHQVGASAGAAQVGGSSVRPPPFLDKILGNDRTNFNEAGLDQGMSSRAAKRAWGGHAAGHATTTSSGARVPGTTDAGSKREASDHGSDARMSCNEADECSMASKDVKKIWASASARAGTLTERAPKPSNAERRITEQRRAEGTQQHAPQAADAHAAGHAPAAQAGHDH